jgi:outer membrane biosynthesis protein TonB
MRQEIFSARWISISSPIMSTVLHSLLFAATVVFLKNNPSRTNDTTVKVSLSRPVVPAEPTKPLVEPRPEVTPKPRQKVRTDNRVKEVVPETAEPEVRAGLSDSLALEGTARANAPQVAVGNSSLAEVNPEDADKPVPSARAAVDAVVEAAADSPADCPLPPRLDLTDDALNAGLTNAEVVIEVTIDSFGAVENALLKSGTGFAIDEVARSAALRLKCEPALLAGQPVAVTGKKLVWKVIYE